ncbi:MAG: N-acetylglucosamine-6-phosphate deacetylase [Ilumatobacteraceae bacterium]
MFRLECARTLLPDGNVGPACVEVDGGIITSVESLTSVADNGHILAPAFVDLQVNGVDDVDVWRTARDQDRAAWDRIGSLLIEQGVGTWCPTLVTANSERYAEAVSFIGKFVEPQGDPELAYPERPRVAGVHLEGPFLGSAIGAHRADLVEAADVGFLESMSATPAIITVGAENPGVVDVIRTARRAGIVASIGHSRPSRDQYEAAVDAGARMITHLFNAMSGMAHREPGLATWVLNDDRVVAGLIADGVHVHPDMIRLAFRCKPDAIALVTDAVAWRVGSAGPVSMQLIDGAPRLTDGTLAGSVATMTDCVRVCVKAGVPLADALMAATSVPARVLGLDDVGRIAVGCRADLVELDADMNVVRTILGGRLMSRNSSPEIP